jgi:glycosyltransferase involved in cell wall biosynthesis
MTTLETEHAGATRLGSGHRPIAIIGPYPAYGGGVGGISRHIQRIRPLLMQAGLNVRIYQIGGAGCPDENIFGVKSRLGPLQVMLGRERDSVVHCHLIGFADRLAPGLVNRFRSGPLMLTVHGDSLQRQLRGGAVGRYLLSRALRAYDHIIGVSPQIVEDIRHAGVSATRTSMLPAFVPPVVTPADRAAMPTALQPFAAAHAPLVAFNSSIVSVDGEDLYGHDLALDLLSRLRADGLNGGLIICLCGNSPAYADLWARIQARAQQADVLGHVLFIEPGHEFGPVLELADVFVRPTRFDGWGVSVAEAVLLNVPAVASDVCDRVSGAYLFKSGDLDDLVDKVKSALAQGVPPGAGAELTYHLDLINLYKRLADVQ